MRKALHCVISVAMLLLAQSIHAEMTHLAYNGGQVSYTLTRPDNVIIQVYLRDGTYVTTLFAGDQREGKYRFVWTGAYSLGKSLPAGTYQLRASIGRKVTPDTTFAKTGCIQFGNPCDVNVDADGSLYVLDRGVPEIVAGKPTGKFTSPCGLYHFTATGAPLLDFDAGKSHCLPLASCGNWFILTAGQIIGPFGGWHAVDVFDRKGTPLYTIGGWMPGPDPGDEKEGRRGLGGSQGGGLGADGKIFIRNRCGEQLKAFDRAKPKGEGWLYTFNVPAPPAALNYAPIGGCYVGPSLTSDGKSAVYATTVAREVRRYDDTGNAFAYRYQYPGALGDVIGLTADRGMLYVVERTPSARLYQFWDSNESLSKVYTYTDAALVGLRDVALSPDGKSLYLLEDGDNFGKSFGDMQGKARLFKYAIGFTQEVTCKVILTGDDATKGAH